MSRPAPYDFIDAHTHGSVPSAGIFSVENLMAHENRVPVPADGVAYTAGIHPWHLDEANKAEQLEYIHRIAADQCLIALGEAGFDRLRGPSAELQRSVFGEQVKISEEAGKPLVIHCVRWWEELLSARRRYRPGKPWLVHGFRGKKELGLQLISAGMYLSFWFDFIIRPESTALVKALPSDRIFLETDGAGVDIRNIYGKVARDLTMSVDELKKIIFDNYMRFFVNEE